MESDLSLCRKGQKFVPGSELESETTRYPWTPKSTFDPQPGANPALGEFLMEVCSDPFNPG